MQLQRRVGAASRAFDQSTVELPFKLAGSTAGIRENPDPTRCRPSPTSNPSRKADSRLSKLRAHGSACTCDLRCYGTRSTTPRSPQQFGRSWSCVASMLLWVMLCLAHKNPDRPPGPGRAGLSPSRPPRGSSKVVKPHLLESCPGRAAPAALVIRRGARQKYGRICVGQHRLTKLARS